MREFPFYLAGEPCRSAHRLEVLNPYDRSPAGRTWVAGDPEFERAAQAAVAAAAHCAACPRSSARTSCAQHRRQGNRIAA